MGGVSIISGTPKSVSGTISDLKIIMLITNICICYLRYYIVGSDSD